MRFLSLCALALVPVSGSAQSVAERVARVSDGVVEVRFAARAGVCGDGAGTIRVGRSMMVVDGRGWSGRDHGWSCESGPVRVRLTRASGESVSLRIAVGASTGGTTSVSDAGAVSADAAANWLISLAQAGGSTQLAERAIFAATLADSATIWPQLLTLARDDRQSRRSREAAIHALAQIAAGSAGEEEPDDDERARAEAVFALSRQPREEAVTSLSEVVRHNHSARVRAQALFWLGETHDSRALSLFEELLKGRN